MTLLSFTSYLLFSSNRVCCRCPFEDEGGSKEVFSASDTDRELDGVDAPIVVPGHRTAILTTALPQNQAGISTVNSETLPGLSLNHSRFALAQETCRGKAVDLMALRGPE